MTAACMLESKLLEGKHCKRKVTHICFWRMPSLRPFRKLQFCGSGGYQSNDECKQAGQVNTSDLWCVHPICGVCKYECISAGLHKGIRLLGSSARVPVHPCCWRRQERELPHLREMLPTRTNTCGSNAAMKDLFIPTFWYVAGPAVTTLPHNFIPAATKHTKWFSLATALPWTSRMSNTLKKACDKLQAGSQQPPVPRLLTCCKHW